jgi:ubiquinone/menaquinone biosynthesis C-methylase UbiE
LLGENTLGWEEVSPRVLKDNNMSGLSRFIPSFAKPTLKKIYYFPFDVIGKINGRDGMIPPRSMIFVGDGDFLKVGQVFGEYFVELGGLRPDDRVLDVGSGIGRMAIPLTNYLSQEGEYWGFDIVKSGVDWCQKRISPRFPNFHFIHSDVLNKHYNPGGNISAQEFRFPFEDGHFDFVFLTSVFTHMLAPDLENYLGEISRVLKPGGKCLITFFLLDAEAKRLVQEGRSSIDLPFELEHCRYSVKDDPERAIAYDADFIIDLFNKLGLEIVTPIHFGSWCERAKFLSYQDIVIATKPVASAE